MGYVESNLVQGEQVRYRAELHWAIFCTLGAILTLFIAPTIRRMTSEFAVTNKRVIIKVGLISRRTIEMNLQKVESIGIDQSMFGRIFGYGAIVVSGTGGAKERFAAIANPLAFRKAVNDATMS